jgi:hypothetical protein
MGDSAGYSETASTITVNPTAGFTVIENPSSGNVRTCLDKAQTGGAHTFSYLTDAGVTKTVTVNFAAGGGYRAVGTLSLDSTPNANWNFRNLNGQLPRRRPTCVTATTTSSASCPCSTTTPATTTTTPLPVSTTRPTGW